MGDKTQSLPIYVANVSTFPSSVTKIGSPTGCFEDKEDESDKIYPIQGRLFKASAHAWLSWGPNLEVVKTTTGLKVASCVFDGGLNSNPVVTCVAELPAGDGCGAQLAVGIQCEEDSGLVCVYEALSGNPRVVRTVQMPDKVLSICVVSPGVTHDSASPLCPLLCSMAGVLAVGLAGARVMLLDLKRGARQYPRDVTHQLVTLAAGDTLAERQRLAACTGDHLSFLLNWDAFSSTHYSLLSADGTIIHKMSMPKVWVTALLYIPQIASLVVGFNFGCFQIWNLLNLQLVYTSEFLDDPLPVKSLSFQEPSDDPCNCCYLWVVFGTSKLSFQPPLLAMYSLGFKRKQLIPQYGMLYQDFQSCTLSFEHELQREEVNSSSRFVSCNVIEKTSFTQSIMYDGDDSDVSLSVFAWASPHHCHLSLFDLNQWYKDQMPADVTRSKNVNSFWATYTFVEESDRLLDIRMKEETLAPFRAALTQDEHLFPSALTFGSVCMFDRKTISCFHPGIQRAVLKTLSDNGPLGVASPTTIYLQCVEVGLCPRFMENINRMNVTLEDQRDFLLSLALEHHLERLVLSCAISWSDGSQGSLGCSLQLWLNWALQRAYVCKTRVDHLCISLFNHSGESLDRYSYRELDQCFRQLRLLAELYRDVFNYCLKNPRTHTPQDFEKQMQSLEVVSLYVEVVKWFVNVKLLPEFPEGTVEDCEDPRIPYPVSTLSKFYQERRTGLLAMSDLSNSSKKEAQKGCSDALFIDGLLWHECGGDRLFYLWEQDGGSGLYPPPSLQSLLRTYLLVDIPTHVKHSITLYLFLDLTALLEVQDRYHSVFEHFIKFPAAMGVSSSMIKITQAFWLLDHRDFSEAVEMLRDPLVHWKDLKPWQNQLVIKVLVRHGKNKLALDYIRACGLPMTKTDDIKLMVTLLLSNGFISQAFTFQRKHRTEENAMELLQHFFAGCQELNKLNQVLSMVMSREEEEVFQRYLEGCQHPRAHDLHVMYYLAQSRIVEAVEANDRFNPLLLSTPNLTPRRKMAADRNSGFREEIVRAYAKTIPPATWELARYRPREAGAVSTWKQVERPVAVPVAVREPNKETAHYRSSLIRTTMEKARETYNAINVPSPSTPATSRRTHGLSEWGTPVQSATWTPGSRGNKRERDSSESSLLLHTPHVRRITQGGLTLSHSRIAGDVSTPPSILKVRRTLRRSLSRESLGPSVTGTATTPDLDESMEEKVGVATPRSARLIRFDIPSPDVSVCSSTAEHAQVEEDAERNETDSPMEYEEEEEEQEEDIEEDDLEVLMERGTQPSFVIPREISPRPTKKKYKPDTPPSEHHTCGYFLRSPKRNFVGGTPRKPLQTGSRVSLTSAAEPAVTSPPDEVPSERLTSEVPPPLVLKRVEEDHNPFRLEIVNVVGGQTDTWDSLEKSSESGEEFLSARSRFSLDKLPPPVGGTQNIQPRPAYSGYVQSVDVVEETSIEEGPTRMTTRSSRTVTTSEVTLTTGHGSERPTVEEVCEAENLPISIDTGNLEPDVEIEINVVPCARDEGSPQLVPLEAARPESPGIELIEPDSSDKEIEEEEEEEDDALEESLDDEEEDYEDYPAYQQVEVRRRPILPDHSLYIPSSQATVSPTSGPETVDDNEMPEDDGESDGVSSQRDEQVSDDVESRAGQEVKEVDPEELLEKSSDIVCVSDDVEEEVEELDEEEEEEEGLDTEEEVYEEEEEESFGSEYDYEEDDDIMEVDEDEVELATVAPSSSDKSHASEIKKKETAENISGNMVCTTTASAAVPSQSSDDSDILEIGGNETIADFAGNETIHAINWGNDSKRGDKENISEISGKEQHLVSTSVRDAIPEQSIVKASNKVDIKIRVHAVSIERREELTTAKTDVRGSGRDTEEEAMEVVSVPRVETPRVMAGPRVAATETPAAKIRVHAVSIERREELTAAKTDVRGSGRDTEEEAMEVVPRVETPRATAGPRVAATETPAAKVTVRVAVTETLPVDTGPRVACAAVTEAPRVKARPRVANAAGTVTPEGPRDGNYQSSSSSSSSSSGIAGEIEFLTDDSREDDDEDDNPQFSTDSRTDSEEEELGEEEQEEEEEEEDEGEEGVGLDLLVGRPPEIESDVDEGSIICLETSESDSGSRSPLPSRMVKPPQPRDELAPGGPPMVKPPQPRDELSPSAPQPPPPPSGDGIPDVCDREIPGSAEEATHSLVDQKDEMVVDVQDDIRDTATHVSSTQKNTSKLEEVTKKDVNMLLDDRNVDAQLVKETSMNVESEIPVVEEMDSQLVALPEVESSPTVDSDAKLPIVVEVKSEVDTKASTEVCITSAGEQTPVVTQGDLVSGTELAVGGDLEMEVVGVNDSVCAQPSITTTVQVTGETAVVMPESVDQSLHVAVEPTVSETVEEHSISQVSPEHVLQLSSESTREDEDEEMAVELPDSHGDHQVDSQESPQVLESLEDSKRNLLSSEIQLGRSEHREIASDTIVIEDSSMELEAEPNAEVSLQEEVSYVASDSDVPSDPLDKAFIDSSESSSQNNSFSADGKQQRSEADSDSTTVILINDESTVCEIPVVEKAVSVAVDSTQPRAESSEMHTIEVFECEPVVDSDMAENLENPPSSTVKEDISEENKIQSDIEIVKQQPKASQSEGIIATSEYKGSEAMEWEEGTTKKEVLPLKRRTRRSVSCEPPNLHDVLESVKERRAKSVQGDDDMSLSPVILTSEDRKPVESEFSDGKTRASESATPQTEILTRSRRRQSDLGNLHQFQETLRSPSHRQKGKSVGTGASDEESSTKANGGHEKADPEDVRELEETIIPTITKVQPTAIESHLVTGKSSITLRQRKAKSDLGDVKQLQETVQRFSSDEDQNVSVVSKLANEESLTRSTGRRAKSDLGDLKQLQETVGSKEPDKSKGRRWESPVSGERKVRGSSRPRSVCALDRPDDLDRPGPKRARARSLHGDGPWLQLAKIDPLVGIFTKGRHTGQTPAKKTSSGTVEIDRSPASSDPGSSAAMSEFAASRRLTRHQKAILERSGDASFRSHSNSSSQQDEVFEQSSQSRESSKAEPTYAEPSEKLTPTRKSKRTKANSKASEHDSPTNSTVSEAGSSVYSLRSKRGQIEPPLVTPPRRKRKNVLTDEKEDEVLDEDISSIASDFSEETTSIISKARSLDGDYVRKSSRLATRSEPDREASTTRKRTRTFSESNLSEVAASTPSPRRSTRIPLKGLLETITEESLRETTPIQQKRVRKRPQRVPFISPITEEEKRMAESRLRELRPSPSRQGQRKSSGFALRQTFQLAVVKKKGH